MFEPSTNNAKIINENNISIDNLYEENECSDCFHMMNLNYTSYTKELCKTKNYPYIHVDIEINYFEFWISLDPIRIPQKRKRHCGMYMNKKLYYHERRKERQKKNRKRDKRKHTIINNNRFNKEKIILHIL